MGACGYLTPLDGKKKEIIKLVSELEAMKELTLFRNLIFEYDVLGFYSKDEKFSKALTTFMTDYTQMT